jgi:hypothetical protein
MAHAKKAHAKQATKRRGTRTLPVLGAAGASLVIGGSASATAPATDLPAQNTQFRPVIALAEEEISDVSLATFYVFDKEGAEEGLGGIQLAAARGCGGGGCGGCRGCGGGGCAARGCAGCAAAGCRGCAGVGCRGCRGCAGCGGVWVGGCGGCGGGCGACWVWTPIGWIPVC